MGRLFRAVASAALLAGICTTTAGAQDMDDGASYDTTIRTTSYGIPHIEADDFASLGYGIGYVQARDNLCVLAEDYLTINGRRAEFLGRDGSYEIPPANSNATNVDSDFFWRHIITPARLELFRDGLNDTTRAGSRGFAAGYNRYLRELRAGDHPGRHAACREADWLRPITLDDMLRRYIRLAVIASSSAFTTEIANAAPPADGPISLPSVDDLFGALTPDDMPLADLNIGSNAYGLAPGATRNGQSILLGNPHFPWVGTERLYQMQLTLPGRLNIFGASLYGIPAVLIGFNEHFAWSHTVSTAYRFTFYRLSLNPNDATQYRFDGRYRDLEAVPITIAVREDDGSLSSEQRTLYRSRFGPMLELTISGIPVLSWSHDAAYTLRDANIDNTRLIDQFFQWNQAQSLDEFIDLHHDILGTPWINTVATGPGQRAYYGDVTVVPNVPDRMAQQTCDTLLSPVFSTLMSGLPVLDGSRSECDWRTDPDAPAPGIFGPSNLPTLERDDYVANMNDSFWLTNPQQPLTGYAAIIGDEATERSLRTRLGLRLIQDRLDGSDGRGAPGFTLDNLKDITLAGDVYSADLARDTVVNSPACRWTFGRSVRRACRILRDWEGTTSLDAVGAHLWREFWTYLNAGLITTSPTRSYLWRTGFSPDDPVNTPRDLRRLNPLIRLSLHRAVSTIESAGIPLDAPFGTIQYSGIHGAAGEQRIPIFGGLGDATGTFTVAGEEPLDATGYPVVRGNSYIQAVTWAADCEDHRDGCRPIAEGFLTYSQSADPASPHFRDQTEAYSDKQWIRFPFTEEEIAADPNLRIESLNE